MKNLIVLVVLASSLAASAEVYDASTGYVTLTRTDKQYGDTEYYSLTPDYQYHNWSDEKPFHEGTNYYVGAGLSARIFGDSYSITSTVVVSGIVDPRGGSSKIYTFTDLRMLAGSKISHNQINKKAGNITILSEDPDKPVLFSYDRNNEHGGFRSAAKIIGSANSRLKLTMLYATSAGSSLDVMAGSDWTEFKGTFSISDGQGVRSNNSAPLSTPGTFAFGSGCYLSLTDGGSSYSLGNLSFREAGTITNSNYKCTLTVAGTFDTGTNCQWLCNSDVKAGTLVLNDGLSFVCTSTTIPLLTVTNRLVIGEDVSVYYAKLTPAIAAEPLKQRIMRLSPEAVQAGLPDVTKVGVRLNQLPAGTASLVYEDDPDVSGGKLVCLTHDPIVSYIGPNEWTEGDDGRLALDPDADMKTRWSDGLFPHSDAGYIMNEKTNIVFAAPTDAHPNRTTDFPGKYLICKDLANVYVQGSLNCRADLVFYDRAVLYFRTDGVRFGGSLLLNAASESKSSIIRGIGQMEAYVDLALSGSGYLTFNSYYPEKNGGLTAYLSADNTAWTGTLKTSWELKDKTDFYSDTSRHTQLVVGDGRSLGGGPAAFCHNAIRLENYTEIRFTNTTAMAAATRGVCVLGNGELRVDADHAATIASPVTLVGTLRKTGTGVLSLAGGIRYGLNNDLADAIAPTAGSNVVRVVEGALKFAQAEGSRIELAAGTKLLVDAAAPVVNTTAATPVVSDDGAPCIVPDAATVACPEGELDVPLLKVSSAAADVLEPILVKKSPWKGVKCTAITRTDDGGVATFTGHYERLGLMLIFH